MIIELILYQLIRYLQVNETQSDRTGASLGGGNVKMLHELPNSTSNINDTHQAYFHFENKRHAVQQGTHVILGKV